MSEAASLASTSRRADFRSTTGALALFTVTIFLSALLLFSVQPMFAKMVLPKLGGSPSVWAVSMCFFQAVLLGGYCYAHLLNRYAPARLAPLIHLGVLAVALLALPIGLPGDAEPPAGDAYLWLVGILAIGVGLPFFAVSANAPLLQSWFSRSGHRHASDPYFLYAASNLGSLIALIAYPLAVEPLTRLGTQATLWTAGFVVLALAIGLCGLAVVSGEPIAKTPEAHAAPRATSLSAAPPSALLRARWVGLAFVPSALLVAFTTYVTTDIASAPLLWVLPLAAFLLTFILVFRERPALPHGIMLQLQPALAGAFLLGISSPGQPWRTIAAVAAIAGAFVTTIVAHRELYERRPDPMHLTEFYLWMSVGGVLGGVFSALIAPQIFASMWEMPLLMALGLACRPTVAGPAVSRNRTLLLMGLGLVMVALASMAFRDGWLKPDNTLVRPGIMVVFIGLVLLSQQAWRQLCLTAVPLAAMAFLPSALNRGDAERSFFGVHRVFESPDGQMRVLMHGTTIHGAERLRDGDGKPVSAALPSTYYYPGGPLAQGVEAARQSTNKPAGGLAVGVVGLGTGSMACHSRSDERWRFYEIDPVVMKIARDPSRFTFLSRCRPDAEFVLGDARLTLGKAPASGYDYLVVDAFSSDAVPVHLLTVEALGLYLSKLSPNGLLALHVSNRHLDLIGVTAALVQALPGIHGVFASDAVPGDALDATSSQVVFIAKSATALAPLQSRVRVAALPKTNAAPWTDDFSDIVTAVRRRR